MGLWKLVPEYRNAGERLLRDCLEHLPTTSPHRAAVRRIGRASVQLQCARLVEPQSLSLK